MSKRVYDDSNLTGAKKRNRYADNYGGYAPGTVKTTKTETKKNNRPQKTIKGDDYGGYAPGTVKTTNAPKKNNRPQRAVKGDDYGGYAPGTTKTTVTKSDNYGGYSPGYVRPRTNSVKSDETETTKRTNPPKSNPDLKDRGWSSSTNPSSQPAKKTTTNSVKSSQTKRYEQAFGSMAGGGAETKRAKWNKEEVMRQRREAAKAAGKGNWNAQEEMKKRRESAKAAGKGNWNAEAEMKKRREAAMAKKKGGKA